MAQVFNCDICRKNKPHPQIIKLTLTNVAEQNYYQDVCTDCVAKVTNLFKIEKAEPTNS